MTNRKLTLKSCAVRGPSGKSAYEVAVAEGYTGTAEEYNALLASVPEYIAATYGSPTPAITASQMIDEQKVYLYIGNEAGFRFGYTYAFVQGAWQQVNKYGGEDGYSPSASVSKEGNTATVSITDKNGTTTAQIHDGIATDAQVATAAGTWLSQNLATPSTPPIDSSLTVANAAADAKETGDAVGELKSKINDVTENTYNINTSGSGRYGANTNTGVIAEAGQNYFGMTAKVPCNELTRYTASAFGITYGQVLSTWYASFYNEDGTFVETINSGNNKKYYYTFTSPANARYLYVHIYCGSGITLTENSALQVEVGAIVHPYIDPVTAIDVEARNKINAIDTPVDIEIEEKPGYYNANGGIVGQNLTNLEVYTNLIDVRSLYALAWDLAYTDENSMWVAYASFDASGTFIERTVIVNSVTSAHQADILNIPDNISYISFTYRTFGQATFTVNGRANIGGLTETVMQIDDVEIGRNALRSSIGVNVNRFKPFYDHLFIDKISGQNVIIPSESLFNIQISHRLGFDMIEANVQPTSDGNFIVMHGVSGKFGQQVEHIDGETDISNTAINSVTLAWIKSNVRYKSIYEKYRVAPPSLEEFLYECRKNCMIPLVTCRDAGALAIVKEIMGEGNFVAYNGTRETTSATIMTYPSLSTKEEILALCETFGKPYMYCMANPTDFTDSELLEIVGLLHTNGYWIGYAGSYVSETESQRLLALGFDFCASKYQVNDFENGNLCNLSADIDYSDFATTGSVSDNLLTLAVGDTITPATIPNSLFLGKGSLHILFSGSITVKLGRYIDSTFSSDGSHAMWFSTYFIHETPTFALTATDATDIISIDYRASKA